MSLKDRIARLADGSRTARDIADALGCHVDAVYTACKNTGCRIKPAPLQEYAEHNPDGPWTDDKANLVRKLWIDGLSAGRIAAEIDGVTRNAVIGKLHRMGLTRSDRSVNKFKARPTDRPKPPKKIASRPPEIVDMPISAPEPVIPLGERKSIIDLGDRDCRWPIGDPQHADFHFCGKTKVAGLPYCEHHARRAYRAPEPSGRVTRASRQLAKV